MTKELLEQYPDICTELANLERAGHASEALAEIWRQGGRIK